VASATTSDSTPDSSKIVVPRGEADRRVALRQLVTTLVPIAALFAVSGLLVGRAWWATIPIGVLNGLLLVRMFGLFHDCVHGSFLPTRRANAMVGHALGLVVATPFHEWGRRHHLHHATSSDLDRRGWWDFPTFTVREYLSAPWPVRVGYRAARHPMVLFTVAPLLFFAVVQRVPAPGARLKHVVNVVAVDVAVVAALVVLVRLGDPGAALVVYLVPAYVSSTVGFWFFFLQHQFPAAHWARHGEWTWIDAAFKGSAFIDLPRVLRWFSADLGYHHVHHLAPRMPNHRLAALHEANPQWPRPAVITVRSSRSAFVAHLWDEERRTMVSFADLARRS
jgi:omega-6 fatty acid desaturase (delta-12 desaturase)